MVNFTPGKFAPVVEVAQRQTGQPAAVDTSFEGLTSVAKTTLQVSLATAIGHGASVADPTPVNKLASIIGNVLALRNVVEQLNHVGVYTRASSVIRNARGQFLEPFVRAYNFYGHFEHDGKEYVTRDLERAYIKLVFAARKYATPEIADGLKHTEIAGKVEDVDISLYSLSENGDIVFSPQVSLKDYLVTLTAQLISQEISTDVKIPLLQECLDIATEASLKIFLRKLRSLFTDYEAPDRSFEPEVSEGHKKAMKSLFGSELSSEDNVIPNPLVIRSVNNAYTLMRRVSMERGVNIRCIDFPRYEGGSASQLATLVDDVLCSSINLSLVDSTAAIAFETSYGNLARFRSGVGHSRDELLRELVSQSIIKN